MSTELEQQIEYLYEQISLAARAGIDPETAAETNRRTPFGSFSQEVVDGALDRFFQKVKLIRVYDEVKSVTDMKNTGTWYTGPDFPTAVYWPPVKREIEKSIGSAVAEVDAASSKVLESLSPPGLESFDSRGLVLGYVQSGKTTNFTALMAKAADVGFRLFIVLAGMTDSLRRQTQTRLNEQLMVESSRWLSLTTDYLGGDFGGDQAVQLQNAATLLSNPSNRIVAVVKKNGKILAKLNHFIKSGKTATDSCPILIIDDEADQASINVSPASKNEISAINNQIRQLLRNKKTAYVAYTGTPFANILIDTESTDDLYPRDFVHVLPKPVGYYGSEALFGREPLEFDEEKEFEGLDVIRRISEKDADCVRPWSKSRDRAAVAEGESPWSLSIPESLIDAVKWFILATAARRVRGHGHKHSSMLIHTALRNDVHEATKDLLEAERRRILKDFREGTLEPDLQFLWETETNQVSASEFGLESVQWDALRREIPAVLDSLEIVIDNYRSTERLEYPEDGPAKTVIAIGGNTLSRGLTLEGLVCSYFVRNSTAYDTLLQMGRWFGFRPGYADLPRIWMTEELEQWFRDLALVEVELRQDLLRYAKEPITPLQFQARIRTHKSLQVTARAKQQSARTVFISYSGEKLQTILFKDQDKPWLDHNIEATRRLVKDLRVESVREHAKDNGTIVLEGATNGPILKFLQEYNFHEDSALGDDGGQRLIDYITKEGKNRSINQWNVSFYGRTGGATDADKFIDLGLKEPIALVTRSQMLRSKPGSANIKTLVGSLDRLNDFVADKDQLRKVTEDIRNASTDDREALIREAHDSLVGSDVAHLVIYAIDKDSKTSQPADFKHRSGKNKGKLIAIGNRRKDLQAKQTMIGVGIFFPDSNSVDKSLVYVSAPAPDPDTLERLYAAQEEEIRMVQSQVEEHS